MGNRHKRTLDAICLGLRVAVFHRPHPRKEAKKSTIRDVREFLTTAGLTP
jgi:hypothetical protein